MIKTSMKKILSSVVIATYLIVSAAPVGLCVSNMPTLDAGVDKPVLRETSPSAVVKAAPIASAVTPAKKSNFLKLEGDISITKGNPKISLSLRDSDVEQVLRMFADKAGLNIIFHDSVKGKVTLDLVNVPLNNAFKLVMQVTDLTYYIDNNTMVVTSAEEAQKLNLAKQELMPIPVKYVDAGVLANFLNTNIFSINKPGLSNSQIAVTNPITNEILIFGTQNDYLMAQKVINQFDVKPLSQDFVVNHSTPKEMAALVCSTLFGATGGGGGASSGGGSEISLGEGINACKITNSVTAGELVSMKNDSLSVTYFPQRGIINVFGGSAQQMQLVKDFIAKNDKKQPQAYLEVSIIELNEDGSRNFNNSWKVWMNNIAFNFDGTTSTNELYPTFFRGDSYDIAGSGTGADATPASTLSKFTGTPTIAYTMSYLIKNNKGRVLANPRIMITNGQQSTIDLSSDYVKKVTSQYIAGTGSMQSQVQKTYEIGSDEGIKVELTPFISPDGYVTMNIKPEYSTIKEKVPGDYNATTKTTDIVATLLQRRNLDLKNIRIKDGETLVIGGMIREVETKNISKFPVLGDLPGVGMFFRNSDSVKSREELVIMITPKIIKENEDIVNNPGATL